MPPRHIRPPVTPRGPVSPVHRGPQAAAIPTTAAIPFHAPNAALLIDFDNVTMGVRSDLNSELRNLLSSDIVKGKVSVQRAYADWRRYPQYIVPLAESSIDLIFAPAYGSSKKNATDIRLAIDALELVFTRPEIGTFILLSGDSDFSSLVIKLKEYGKYVIGVGIRESSSDLLVQNCDEYYSYNALAGLVNTREEEVSKWDPWELAGEAVLRMKRNGDVMRADRLKQVMQQIDSSFDEKNLGMSKFTRFVQEAAHRGILNAQKMENGQLEVDLSKGAVAPADSVATDAPSASVAAALATGDTPEPREHRERSRRGRGRGRSHDERRPRLEGAERAQGAEATAQMEADLVTTPSAAPQPSPRAERAPRVAPPAPRKAAEPVADTIGLSGMRLTRDEAFDLVRKAVASATATGTTPTRATDVRRAAREILGRDSESLSERNFNRILKDAHDADIIDLRRRGEDYEVSAAVSAAPITEQLGAAEQANKPHPPAPAAPLARGMGLRGVSSHHRGGAKGSALPLDLLSVGVVDYDVAPTTPSEPVAPATPPQPPVSERPSVVSVPETAPAAPMPSAKPTRARKTTTVRKTAAKSASKPAAKSATKTAARTSTPRAAAAKTARKKTAAKK